jgi:uncharacterized protein (DUF4415 family)/uncharacterized DUF497 family protein
MHLTFDPAKDNSNQQKHGVSLTLASEFEWEDALCVEDLRRDYGEPGKVALGYIGLRLFSIVFVDRGLHVGSSFCAKRTLGRSRDMPKLKAGTVIPTPEEDAAIQRGIDADPDAMELTDGDVRRGKRMGRPPLDTPKVPVTIRYDQDVVDAFRATGDGWQTRMNAALREWLRDHEAV